MRKLLYVRRDLPKVETVTSKKEEHQVVQDMKFMAETQDVLKNERHIEVLYESNPETDFIVTNPDGTATLVAYAPSINGVRYLIEPGRPTKIPESIYNLLQEHHYRNRIALKQPSMYELSPEARI